MKEARPNEMNLFVNGSEWNRDKRKKKINWNIHANTKWLKNPRHEFHLCALPFINRSNKKRSKSSLLIDLQWQNISLFLSVFLLSLLIFHFFFVYVLFVGIPIVVLWKFIWKWTFVPQLNVHFCLKLNDFIFSCLNVMRIFKIYLISFGLLSFQGYF